MHYKILENALDMFAEEVGVGEVGAKELLVRALATAEYRAALQSEMLSALSDPGLDWVALLNEGRTVACPETQSDGRALVLELLWDDVFPGRPRPT